MPVVSGTRSRSRSWATSYGRDLPAILSEGAAIVASDPLRRIQFIWEAYWGPYYESRYGMTLTGGLNAAAAAAFPIGFGLINWSEVNCTGLLDYQANMATAQANGLSWTWWDWLLPGTGASTCPRTATRTISPAPARQW